MQCDFSSREQLFLILPCEKKLQQQDKHNPDLFDHFMQIYYVTLTENQTACMQPVNLSLKPRIYTILSHA